MLAPLMGLGVGFLVGLRFKASGLVLVVLVAIIFLLATGGVNWSNVGWTVFTAVAIEAGYVFGVTANQLLLEFQYLDRRRISRWRL
jgi:hypothetical protein